MREQQEEGGKGADRGGSRARSSQTNGEGQQLRWRGPSEAQQWWHRSLACACGGGALGTAAPCKRAGVGCPAQHTHILVHRGPAGSLSHWQARHAHLAAPQAAHAQLLITTQTSTWRERPRPQHATAQTTCIIL